MRVWQNRIIDRLWWILNTKLDMGESKHKIKWFEARWLMEPTIEEVVKGAWERARDRTRPLIDLPHDVHLDLQKWDKKTLKGPKKRIHGLKKELHELGEDH